MPINSIKNKIGGGMNLAMLQRADIISIGSYIHRYMLLIARMSQSLIPDLFLFLFSSYMEK